MPRSIFSIGALPGVSIEGAYIHPENIEKVKRLIEAMPEIETRAYQKACTNFGKMLAKYVRKCIMSNGCIVNRYGWRNLNNPVVVDVIALNSLVRP